MTPPRTVAVAPDPAPRRTSPDRVGPSRPDRGPARRVAEDSLAAFDAFDALAALARREVRSTG